MIDVILAVKFVHVLLAAIMFGTWFALVLFMVNAHRAGNPSVMAVTSQFVVRIELTVMIAAIAMQPLSGFPLAAVIGLSPLDEYWIVLSLILFGAVVAGWLIALYMEFRIRNVTRAAALERQPLPPAERRLFRFWILVAVPTLVGMIGLFLLMVWQPRPD